MNSLKKSYRWVKTKAGLVSATVGAMVISSGAHAGVVDDALTALTANKTDAMTVAGAVIGIIAAVAVVSLIGGLVKKV